MKARWPFSPIPANATSTGALAQRGAHGAADLLGIPFAVEEVIGLHARGPNQALHQVPAETGRMIGGEADVFIEMEQLDPRPVDVRLSDQTVEEGELRCPGGRNEASLAPCGHGLADHRRGVERGRRRQLRRCPEYTK